MIVTFTLIPSAISLVIAGNPSSVAGTLINTFGDPTNSHSARAWVIVPSVSRANRGSTSILTRPSTPPVRSKVGMNNSHAALTSEVVSAVITPSASLPSR